MSLHLGVDAAFPGKPLPRGTTILAAYVGEPGKGSPDALHIWTPEEWNLYLDPDSDLYGGPDLRVLPIYVHDYPGDPVQDAANACDAVRNLGWSPNIARLIFWDAENLIDDSYAQSLYMEIEKGGYVCGKYGSLAYTFRNPAAPGGTWLADYNYTHQPAILPPSCVGLQWRPSINWDFDIFSDFVYRNSGFGLRHGQ